MTSDTINYQLIQQFDAIEYRLNRIEERMGIEDGKSPTPAYAEAAAFVSGSEDDSETSIPMDRDEVANAIVEALDKDTSLNRREKWRLRRVMTLDRRRFSRAREQAIDYALSEMLAARVIVPTEKGVEAAVDWAGILSFLEGLLPIIQQLIMIFGV